MADYDSSLPIKTESDGDVVAKISDATVTTQQLKVNADGSIDVNASFSAASIRITDGTDELAVNTDGSINTQTTLDAATLAALEDVNATITGGTVALDATTLNALENINAVVNGTVALDASTITALQTVVATVSGTVGLDAATLTALENTSVTVTGGTIALDTATLSALENINATVVGTVELGATTLSALENITIDGGTIVATDGGGSLTVDAIDLDIRDLNATSDSVAAYLSDDTGNAYSLTNPLAVEVISDKHGNEIVEFNTTSSLAKNASTNHDYTVAGTTFIGESVWISGSGKLKVEIIVNGVSKYVGFNSTATPNIEIPLKRILKANATEIIRITITNRDQPQDVYSTLTGVEI